MEILQTEPNLKSLVTLATSSAVQAVPARASVVRLVSGETLQVAARLKLARRSEPSMLAVAGIKDDDGTTLLTAGLGWSLSVLENRPVLIIDANSHSKGISKLFHLNESHGLLETLDGSSDWSEAVHRVPDTHLEVLSIGRSERSLASLMSASKVREVLTQLRQRYAFVLADCGRITVSPESLLLASECDGVVAAVAASARRKSELMKFQQVLTRSNIPLIGMVLTRGAEGELAT